jgi:hypothetical protein
LIIPKPIAGARNRTKPAESMREQGPNDCTYFAPIVPAAFCRSAPFGADTFTWWGEGILKNTVFLVEGWWAVLGLNQ